MCIVIDTNTLANVFNSDSQKHEDFFPVSEWVQKGKGKVIFGGTKYINELKKYYGLFLELKKKNRAIKIDSEIVDSEEKLVASLIQDNDFDDQHLVALLRVSGCRLICSLDERAYPFFTHKSFFSPASHRPKIYNQYRNRDLLNRKNIAKICK